MQWIDLPRTPLDFNGPKDVKYAPLPENPGALLGIAAIEASAAKWPDKIAVSDGKVQLSYSELLDRVYGLSAQIRELVPPDRAVASLLTNSAAGPVVIMAAAAAGRTLIPMDLGHPLERNLPIFEESGASAVIVPAGGNVNDGFIRSSIPRIPFDVTKPTGVAPIASEFDPEKPLFVVFTSGSTGRPKGVAYSFGDGAVMMRNFIDTFHVNSSDIIAGVTSLSAGGARDAIAALNTGATIRIIDIAALGLTEALRVMADEGITLLSFVPSVLRAVMAMPGIEHSFAKLRALDLHGERIFASDVAFFRTKLPNDCAISITLGTTETGEIFSWFVPKDWSNTDSTIPVGYPVRGKHIALLDEDGAPSLPHVPGELVVGGPMALGGWQKGHVTQGRFIRDDSGARLYFTGDLIRLRPDGLAEYLGRKDRKVKVRGLWADIGEVEAALRNAAGVNDVVVLSRRSNTQAEELYAVVAVDAPDHPPDIALLRRAVAAATAEHMVPANFHFVATLQRLPNHKPDLVALRSRFDLNGFADGRQ